MEILPCGHVAYRGRSRMCRHLLDPRAEDVQYVRLLTGHGLDFDLCCAECDARRAADDEPELVEACEGCVARFAAQEWGTFIGWRGEPGIAERPEPPDPSLIETAIPGQLGAVVDLAAVGAEPGSVWLLLTADGKIARLDAGTGACTVLATCSVRDEPEHKPWAGQALRRHLHASRNGRFAAVVNDYGQHGQVLDLDRGAITLTLHGGGYHPETVPFSLAFAERHGRTVVVHRTDWNRLDVSDAESGALLTPRRPTSYRSGEPRPPHYLDYFHGALHLSPTGRWLADDGWVWHPIGIPTVWDLHRWLDDNVWESEDGASLQYLCHRQYHWNVPLCWLGDDLLAVSGIGPDEDLMLPGIRVFDVVTGTQQTAFPGPTGPMFATGDRLYCAAADGLQVWDPGTGHRTGTLPGFRPTCLHPGTGELAAVQDSTLRRWPARRPGQASST